MLDRKDGERSIQAAHGRWIMELQKTVEMIEQRLTLLEKKVSSWESQLARRAEVQRKLNAEFDSIRAELRRLGSRQLPKSPKRKNDEM